MNFWFWLRLICLVHPPVDRLRNKKITVTPENFQEIGLCHIRVVEGLSTLVQLSGLVAKLCQIKEP